MPRTVGDVDATRMAGLLARGEAVWIVRRPAEGLLGGLWEFQPDPAAEGEAAGCHGSDGDSTGIPEVS